MPPKSSQNVQNVQFSIFYILQEKESAGGSKFTAYFLSTIFVKKIVKIGRFLQKL